MASWLTPRASAQIQQGITDLGQAFKPPSITEMYMAAKMKSDQMAADRKSAAIQAIRSSNPALANFVESGVSDPAGAFAKSDIYQRSMQPGATPQSLDTSSYAIHGNAKQTFTGQAIDNQNAVTLKLLDPLATGATRFLPSSVSGMYKLPQVQQGGVTVGADEYRYMPGANGALDRENPLEGPEGDKTAPKPSVIGQTPFGDPLYGTVQKKGDGYVGVPLQIQQPAAPAPVGGALAPVGGRTPATASSVATTLQPELSGQPPVSPMGVGGVTVQQAAPVLGLDANSIAGKTGQDLLNSLPQNMQSTVMSILKGQTAFPEGFIMKTPYGRALHAMVTAIDPSFDASNYKVRAATQMEFAKGGPSSPAAQITFGNTAMQHLGRLFDQVDGLGNFENLSVGNYLANVVRNAGMKASGTADKLKAFNVTKQNAMDEVSKFYTASGGSAEERKLRMQQIDEASSPTELKAAIHEQVHDIYAKINALQDRYHQGVGNAVPDFPVIQQSTMPVLQRMGLSAPQGANAASRAQVVAPGPSGSPRAEGPAATPTDPLAAAKAAIARGAPRDAVIKRLKENGIDASGL